MSKVCENGYLNGLTAADMTESSSEKRVSNMVPSGGGGNS